MSYTAYNAPICQITNNLSKLNSIKSVDTLIRMDKIFCLSVGITFYDGLIFTRKISENSIRLTQFCSH